MGDSLVKNNTVTFFQLLKTLLFSLISDYSGKNRSSKGGTDSFLPPVVHQALFSKRKRFLTLGLQGLVGRASISQVTSVAVSFAFQFAAVP